MDLARLVWSEEHQVFSMQRQDLRPILPHRPTRVEMNFPRQRRLDFLNSNSVDVLLVDEGDRLDSQTPVEEWIGAAQAHHQPSVIIVLGNSLRVVEESYVGKRRHRRKKLERFGYTALEWMLESHHHGGALSQERLAEVYVIPKAGGRLPQRPWDRDQELPARPCRNLLLPCGIPKKDRARAPFRPITQPQMMGTEVHVVGHCGRRPVISPEGCLPDSLQCYLNSDQGIRLTQVEELAKAKGLPSEWLKKGTKPPQEVVLRTTSLHILTAVCDAVGSWLREDETDLNSDPWGAPRGQVHQPMHVSGTEAPEEWVYDYPALEPGSEWYNQ